MTHKDLDSVAATAVISLDLCFPWNSSVLNILTKNLKTKKKYSLWSSVLTNR